MQINLPDDAYQAIAAKHSDVAHFVEQLVRQSIGQQETPKIGSSGKSFYDGAVESGLIGGGSEYPADLSTNPKHMEGFGQ